MQQFSLGFRYRQITTSAGVLTNDQGQNNTSIKARFKIDKAGHYAVNAGMFSGASNTSSWNNTGMGTGNPARDLHLKQLYFAAAPVTGLEFQYGGLYVARGEGTEITTYDNDGYLTGQRVSVKKPKQLWFDEVSATQAYLGDAKVPDMWNRYQRLTESNYYQVLFGKKVGKRVGVSADYTEAVGVPTWRSAIGFKAPMVVLDGLRFEGYARSAAGPTPFGWALRSTRRSAGLRCQVATPASTSTTAVSTATTTTKATAGSGRRRQRCSRCSTVTRFLHLCARGRLRHREPGALRRGLHIRRAEDVCARQRAAKEQRIMKDMKAARRMQLTLLSAIVIVGLATSGWLMYSLHSNVKLYEPSSRARWRNRTTPV